MAGRTILVVDDNATNIKLVRDVLQFKGYELLIAEDGASAVAAAREHRPALILMDVQLPGLSGTEAMKILKGDGATKDIPIIALTALAMKGAEENLLAEGFDGYLSKPFKLKELFEMVQARVK
jgi:two-component system, cell cycle response regulator DivK